jgi:hypothetical protein
MDTKKKSCLHKYNLPEYLEKRNATANGWEKVATQVNNMHECVIFLFLAIFFSHGSIILVGLGVLCVVP